MTASKKIKVRSTLFALLSLFAFWTALTGVWGTRTAMGGEFMMLIMLALFLLCFAIASSPTMSKVFFVSGLIFMIGGILIAPAFNSMGVAALMMSSMVLSGTGFIWAEL